MQLFRILIVDSDPVAALVTQYGLLRMLPESATIDVAQSPAVARVHCQQNHIDLLIIDPSIESSAETALLKDLHDEYPEMEVMVLTAYDTPRLRNQIRSLGIHYYLAKPVDLHDLEETVRRVVDTRAHAALKE